MRSSPAESVADLYPQCVSIRKELDSVLVALSNAASESGSTGNTQLQNAGTGALANSSIARQQRLSALTRQFCLLVVQVQNAFEREKASGSLARNAVALWERRVKALVSDAESFRLEAEGRVHSHQQRLADEMRERKALFGAEASRATDHSDELLYAREKEKLQETHSVLEGIMEQGWGIVGRLVAQNTALKNAKTKVLDVASSAGVANTLLGAVGRRQRGDAWLVYGGMVFTLVFFYVVYRLWHRGFE